VSDRSPIPEYLFVRPSADLHEGTPSDSALCRDLQKKGCGERRSDVQPRIGSSLLEQISLRPKHLSGATAWVLAPVPVFLVESHRETGMAHAERSGLLPRRRAHEI
jgi:hypothetical protein